MIHPLLTSSTLLSNDSFKPIKPTIRQPVNLLHAAQFKSNSVYQRDSFELFNNALQKAYQRITENNLPNAVNLPTNPQAHSKSTPLANYANSTSPVEKITSQQASSNILDFISARLHSDAANGATQEELLNRLEQGLKGFIQGFNEAKDQIEFMGLLTPDLAEKIEETYAKVTGGIEDLRQGINARFSADKQINNLPFANQIETAGSNKQSASFALSLTTQDGDKVNINVSKSQQFKFSTSLENSGNESKLSIFQQSSTQQSFNLQVNGDLDAEELTAINALLQDVDSISQEFYHGDLDQAFALAQDLQIDREQLSSLNLDLAKSTHTKAIAAYESSAQHSTSAGLKDLEQLLDKVDSVIKNANQFTEPVALIKDLFSSITQLQSPNENNNNQDLGDKMNRLIEKFKFLSIS